VPLITVRYSLGRQPLGTNILFFQDAGNESGSQNQTVTSPISASDGWTTTTDESISDETGSKMAATRDQSFETNPFENDNTGFLALPVKLPPRLPRLINPQFQTNPWSNIVTPVRAEASGPAVIIGGFREQTPPDPSILIAPRLQKSPEQSEEENE
jgi:hypothetical protein